MFNVTVKSHKEYTINWNKRSIGKLKLVGNLKVKNKFPKQMNCKRKIRKNYILTPDFSNRPILKM